MAKNQLNSKKTPFLVAGLVATLLVLTGCSTDDAAVPEEPVDPQELLNVGITMSSPGLINGIDPAHASGVEVDLLTALTQRLETAPESAEVRWVPTDSAGAAEQLTQGDLDLVVGQLAGDHLSDDMAWIGPYAEATAGLLVHRQPDADATHEPEAISPTLMTTAADLQDAIVCVVAGSTADHPALPVDELILQQSVTECETGLRSGRYDAIAADSLQLSGVLVADPTAAQRYELLLWSEIASELEAHKTPATDELESTTDQEDAEQGAPEDDQPVVPADVLTPRTYWIGVSSQYCADAATALEAVMADGVLRELFAAWDERLQTAPAVLTVDELVSPTCAGQG